ncbi:hypothetical protein AVEN_189397-1 [Araneus ventricosus]|uniref:Uncharacterized protein n=1 Tax=Araneus ventricosus TaxID=182803 RepID=A0A4Y2H902_ARAVE|nr:hypothetical protein AVEN_189397-1 [Araneus ventricosus]
MNRSLRSPRATVPTPSTCFQSGTPTQLSRESFTPLPPFCGFRFCERGSLPSPFCGFCFCERGSLPSPFCSFCFCEKVSLSLSPFCGFRFCERGSLSLPHDRISVLWPSALNGKRDRVKIQTFRPHCISSHRNLALTTGFREKALQTVWSGGLMND